MRDNVRVFRVFRLWGVPILQDAENLTDRPYLDRQLGVTDSPLLTMASARNLRHGATGSLPSNP